MRGFTKVALTLLTSAVIGFGQTNGTLGPGTPDQTPGGVAQGSANRSDPGSSDRAQNMRTVDMRTADVRMMTPGVINYIEGQVTLDGRPLNAAGSMVLQPGQVLATGIGYAEVLLTPGSFLRVGNNSQVRLVAAGLAHTKAQLDRGTALVEVDDLVKGTNLEMVTGGATAQLEKKGLYNFDADQQMIRVMDGKVNVVEASGSKSLGKDDQLLLTSETPLKKSGFDKKAVKAQPLYVWSEARSRFESQANVSVARDVAAYGGWSGPGWYWDPAWSFYSYLPGNGFLNSPFGWGFYSPAYVGYAGYYGVPYRYGRAGYYGGARGRVGGVSAHVSGVHSFAGGGARAGGRR